MDIVSSKLQKNTRKYQVFRLEIIRFDVLQVFPGFLQRLPLREDFEEHSAVLKCFGHLYQLGHPILLKHLMDVIKICCSILHDKQGKEGAKKKKKKKENLIHLKIEKFY